MLDKYGFEFNMVSTQRQGIYVERRPAIPGNSRKVDLITIAGRAEPLLPEEYEYDPIEISIECAFRSNPSEWCTQARNVKRWLQGSGTLRLGDSPDTFFKVYNTEIEQIDREKRIYGKFTVKFICSPFEYVLIGTRERSADEVKYNPYDLCHPVYKIRGEGECQLSVNGNIVRATVKKELIIDTDKMFAYETNGEMRNTSLKGEYEDLYLLPEENRIEISEGYDLRIIPNWRYI